PTAEQRQRVVRCLCKPLLQEATSLLPAEAVNQSSHDGFTNKPRLGSALGEFETQDRSHCLDLAASHPVEEPLENDCFLIPAELRISAEEDVSGLERPGSPGTTRR